MLSYEQVKAIENALGPQAAPPFIEVLEDMGNRVKAELLSELATKKDLEQSHGMLKAEIEKLRGELRTEIEMLRGEVKTDIEKLRGEVRAEIEGLRGELGKVQLMLKVLIGLAVIAIALFSPAAAEIIKLLK